MAHRAQAAALSAALLVLACTGARINKASSRPETLDKLERDDIIRLAGEGAAREVFKGTAGPHPRRGGMTPERGHRDRAETPERGQQRWRPDRAETPERGGRREWRPDSPESPRWAEDSEDEDSEEWPARGAETPRRSQERSFVDEESWRREEPRDRARTPPRSGRADAFKNAFPQERRHEVRPDPVDSDDEDEPFPFQEYPLAEPVADEVEDFPFGQYPLPEPAVAPKGPHVPETVAFKDQGSVHYDDTWFGDHCDLGVEHKKAGQAAVTEDQFDDTSDGQNQMKELIEQVNHMSIDGILQHLLSFYVCMRWVPDDRFVSAMKFEMENVNVDRLTKASETEVTEDEIMKMYASFDAMPLKCGSALHVQDSFSIDKFLEAAKDPNSGLAKGYAYSKKVASTATGAFGVQWFDGGSPKKVRKELADPVRPKVEADIRKVLPFDGFVRPSQRFEWLNGLLKHDTHDFAPKNLFFICFGPRVTSFPHKREDGPHVMADMNMAGCNGLWSLDDIAAHVERVKKLFAPELCLTDDLRAKLKEVFLSTFMEMNEDFFQYMTGAFQQETGFIEAIPRPLRESGNTIRETPVLSSPERGAPQVALLRKGENIILSGYAPDNPGFAKIAYPEEGWIENWMSAIVKANKTIMSEENIGRVKTKYERSARILAGAHTKWIVCDAKKNMKKEIGFEDNFFRNPKAYAKWITVEGETKQPECKLLDPETGCVKCAIAVKTDPWRCNARLGLTPQNILDALAKGEFPLSSKYKVPDLENRKPGKPAPLMHKTATCLLGRKPAMNISRNNDLKHFATYASDDVVWTVTSDGLDNFKMAPRYTVKQRITSYQKYLESKRTSQPLPERTEEEIVAELHSLEIWHSQMANSHSLHVNSQMGPLLAFEEHVTKVGNRPPHFVQYIMTCPCDHKDFSQMEKIESYAGAEVQDFFNAGGAF